MKLNKKNNRGFTLVEIVMVVAILGILSSLAIGKYTNTQKTARENADYVAATSIATATAIALSDKNNTIRNISDLVDLGYLTNEPKPQSVSSGTFRIETSNDSINVYVGDKKFYPKDAN